MIKAVAYNENTLGLLWEDTKTIEVLSSLISEGAHRMGSQHLAPVQLHSLEDKTTRLATLKDFEKYRIQYNSNYIVAA